MMIIPAGYITCPPEIVTYKATFRLIGGNDEKMVCTKCHSQLSYMKDLEPIITELKSSNLKNIYTLMAKNKKYDDAGQYVLSLYKKYMSATHINKAYTYNSWEDECFIMSGIDYATHNILNRRVIEYIIYGCFIGEDIEYIVDIFSRQKQSATHNCDSVMCADATANAPLTTTCSKKFTFDIIDIIEILKSVTNMHTTGGSLIWFWNNQSIDRLFTLIASRTSFANLEFTFTLYPILIELLNKLYVKNEVTNALLSNTIFNIITNRGSLDYVIRYIYQLRNTKVNPAIDNHETLLEFTKIYCASINYDKSYFKSMQNMESFLYEKLFKTDYLVWNDKIFEINKCCPILYPFDNRYVITQVLSCELINDYRYGVIGNRKITVKISPTGISTVDPAAIQTKSFIFKGTTDDEYANYTTARILAHNTNYGGPINKMMLLKNVSIIEIEENIITLAGIYESNRTVKEYIYTTNGSRPLNDILASYRSTIEFMELVAATLKITSFDMRQIVVNANAQLCFAKYVASSGDAKIPTSVENIGAELRKMKLMLM